jgi:hypothetical protein
MSFAICHLSLNTRNYPLPSDSAGMMELNVEHLAGAILPKRHTGMLRNITKAGLNLA